MAIRVCIELSEPALRDLLQATLRLSAVPDLSPQQEAQIRKIAAVLHAELATIESLRAIEARQRAAPAKPTREKWRR